MGEVVGELPAGRLFIVGVVGGAETAGSTCSRFSQGRIPKRSSGVIQAYRYMLWLPWDKRKLVPKWGASYVEELYSHSGDNSSSMDQWENRNEAADNPVVAAQLRSQLMAFFRGPITYTDRLLAPGIETPEQEPGVDGE